MYQTDLLSLAENYNIKIVADPFLKYDGVIEKKDDGTVVITYNNTTHPNRQRFTIAHELGHFISGHLNNSTTMFRDATKSFSLDNFDIYEVEANKAGAEILMPKDTLEHLIYNKGITDIDELSSLLGVSSLALHYRLKNLGMV